MTDREPLPPFGEDKADKYSEVMSTEDLMTESGKDVGLRITRLLRENPDKPGRTLSAFLDSRVELVPGEEFQNRYDYLVRFNKLTGEEAQPAGRHYHEVKNEVFAAAHGRFLVVLEDRDTKEQVRIELNSKRIDDSGNAVEETIYVPAGVAHAVTPLDDGESVLLVLADYPNNEADEFPYEMAV